jgi:hypothetical protein
MQRLKTDIDFTSQSFYTHSSHSLYRTKENTVSVHIAWLLEMLIAFFPQKKLFHESSPINMASTEHIGSVVKFDEMSLITMKHQPPIKPKPFLPAKTENLDSSVTYFVGFLSLIISAQFLFFKWKSVFNNQSKFFLEISRLTKGDIFVSRLLVAFRGLLSIQVSGLRDSTCNSSKPTRIAS